MFGDILRWFSESLAGLCPDPAKPGWQHVIIKPAPVGDLTSAHAEHDSIRGKFVSDWKLVNGKLELNVTIPPNATATVLLPAKSSETVEAEKVTSSGFEAGHAIFKIGSGTYRFVAVMK
jgi:alpha-L-rhamnosidase